MKKTFVFLVFISAILVAHADLVIIYQETKTNRPSTISAKIRGAKIRVDFSGNTRWDQSMIRDLDTGDSVMLFPEYKYFVKRSGSQLQHGFDNMKERAALVDGSQEGLLTPVASGNSEKVGLYDTEIYTWSGYRGQIQVFSTFWVAKDYPNFTVIKSQLQKLDRTSVSRMTQGIFPHIPNLPGMVMKFQNIENGVTNIYMLLSAKENPVNPLIFMVPGDYKEWIPPTKPHQTHSEANTNIFTLTIPR